MLRGIAWFFSIVFHPLLIPTYMLLLLLLVNPYLFGVSSFQDLGARMLLLLVFLYTFFIPAASIGVMYALGMVQKVDIPDRQERIGPYLVTGMLYLWVYYNFSQTGQLPPAFVSFMLGSTVALFLAFLVNLSTKISAHAVGMGGLVAMILISLVWFSYGTFTFNLRGNFPLEITMNQLLLTSVVLAGVRRPRAHQQTS